MNLKLRSIKASSFWWDRVIVGNYLVEGEIRPRLRDIKYIISDWFDGYYLRRASEEARKYLKTIPDPHKIRKPNKVRQLENGNFTRVR